MGKIGTFVQKVLDDISSGAICEPRLFMGYVNSLMSKDGETNCRATWILRMSDRIFFEIPVLERQDIGREFEETRVPLNWTEKRALTKALDMVTKQEKARRKALRERARRWP